MPLSSSLGKLSYRKVSLPQSAPTHPDVDTPQIVPLGVGAVSKWREKAVEEPEHAVSLACKKIPRVSEKAPAVYPWRIVLERKHIYGLSVEQALRSFERGQVIPLGIDLQHLNLRITSLVREVIQPDGFHPIPVCPEPLTANQTAAPIR